MGGRPRSAVSAKRKVEAARGASFLDDFLNKRRRPHVDEPLASSSSSAPPEALASRPPELSPSTPASSSSRAHFDEGVVAEVIWPQPDSPMSAEGASLTELSPAVSELAVAAESEEAGSVEAAASQKGVGVGQWKADHASMCALIEWILNMRYENVKNASDLAKRIGKSKPWLSEFRNGKLDRLELARRRAFLMRSSCSLASRPPSLRMLRPWAGQAMPIPLELLPACSPRPRRSMAIPPSSRSISQPRDRIRGGRCRSFALASLSTTMIVGLFSALVFARRPCTCAGGSPAGARSARMWQSHSGA